VTKLRCRERWAARIPACWLSLKFENRGYAPNLAMLGTDPLSPTVGSPEHAGLLDPSLANESCAGDGWCTKSGYRFRVVATCKLHHCQGFVVVATPVDNNTRMPDLACASVVELGETSVVVLLLPTMPRRTPRSPR
jgi:hypothetical protein